MSERIHETHIRSSVTFTDIGLGDLWSFRELLYFLCWRDISVRYKQTILGGAWAIIQPVMMTGVFSLFFGSLVRMPSDGSPYPVFVLSALVPWTYFANALNSASNSLVNNGNLLSKVYFPRLLLPLSTVVAGLVDMAVSIVVLLLTTLVYQGTISIRLLALPVFIAIGMINVVGVSLWLSAINVRFRDVRYVVPFATQLWMFATPIAYPSSLVTETWRPLYGLNPMVGVVEGFRWAVIGTPFVHADTMAPSLAASVFVLAAGLLYFKRMERAFADTV